VGLGSASSSSTLGKRDRQSKSSEQNEQSKGSERDGKIPFVMDAIASNTRVRLAVFVATRISTTPAIGAAVPQSGLWKIQLMDHLRADGNRIVRSDTADTVPPPTPPRSQDSTSRRNRDEVGELGRGSTGQGRSNEDAAQCTLIKGTGRTDIITHLSCNCGESDAHSSYRQCLVSIRASATYFTALALFDTGAYTSFVNREVVKWLERQQDKDKADCTSSEKISRHDTSTATVGLADTQLSSSIYGSVVFDLLSLTKLRGRAPCRGATPCNKCAEFLEFGLQMLDIILPLELSNG
jgi:hypothetical protein